MERDFGSVSTQSTLRQPSQWMTEVDELVQRYNGDRTGLVLGTVAAVKPLGERHWYLNGIAARRAARSRGVGARLLEPFLARGDAEGIPIYLESSNPRNLSFYRRYGFEDLGPDQEVWPWK